jgi:hypothetical protein
MRSEDVQVEMAGERESKEGGGGGFYTPLTQNITVEALRPGVSGLNPETPGSPETPGKTRILRPSKFSTQEKIPVNVLVRRCLS